MKDYFNEAHPIISFGYFVLVIGFSMFMLHPIYLIIGLVATCIYSMLLSGFKALKFNIVYMIPMLILMATINPMFNHEGATILFYLKSGNPFTLESVIYGVISALMLIIVIIWFSCYNVVMSSDKVIYLFGKIIPSLSLVFTMVLRFVPVYKKRIQKIILAQKCIETGEVKGILNKLKYGVKILSIMTSWSLESAIETSDSMKARGYGLKGRTSFSNFKMTTYDYYMGIWLVINTVLVIVSYFLTNDSAIYFPTIQINTTNYIGYIAYINLCFTPVLLNIMEALKWKYFVSKI
ncbi:cobalt transporter [Candidatus Epulonipiscioides gigas]|nr:cobalt transporter [Epulopiscium sp. SCG-C07WGA-EpuloA2]